MSEFLSYADIFEIKKQINLLNKQGKLLPQRLAFMKARMEVLKKQHASKKENLTNYIFEDPLPAILISLMQLTSALLVELLNLIVLSG
jgi:molecular chaperone GrpE (heat shock protein)